MAIQGPSQLVAMNPPPLMERTPAIPLMESDSTQVSTVTIEAASKRASKADHPTPLELPEISDSSMEERLAKVTEQIRVAASIFSKKLDFILDKSSGRLVVRVLNADTEEIIRELPPQKLLELAARIREDLGVIFDEFA